MKRFGSNRRRAAGARPMKGARPPVAARPADAALGREMRGLVGQSRGRGKAQISTSRLRPSGARGIRGIVTPARAAALLGMLGSGFLLSLATGPTAFGLTRTELPDLTWTDEVTIAAALGLTQGTNVFQLDTSPLEAALERLPAVAGAEVSVELPDAAVVVAIEERVPILAWQVGSQRYLVDREGTLFASVGSDAALPAGATVIDDRRTGADARTLIGGRLDSVDLDVATRLGSLAPADVGSAAPRLRVTATDADGFVLITDGGWVAVFGFYSPATRPTEMVPGQVRLLRSLLAGREATLSRIVLASETDGTYVPKRTPNP
ncbi:MAG TPA: FtsQ-type POTRA domain-containing protein [Candidatus Limnocylindria bacterium]|nr:FtsQ-type POTRA domain-containing protein [Candidatus Limnocylindria bacterium]